MNIKSFQAYWGLNWKSNLLTAQDKKLYAENRLTPKKKDLKDSDFEKYILVLDNLIEDEKERLNGIENKAIQIVGQVSIVIAILALFAPFVIEKVPSDMIFIRILLILGILIITVLFVYSISCALRNFDLRKYEFGKTVEDTLVEHHDGKLDLLNYEIVNDKIFELRTTRHSTNAKASNVIYAFKAFKTAMVILVLYVVTYSILLFFIPEKTNQTVEIGPGSIKELRKQQPPITPVINIQIDSSFKRSN